MGVKMKLHMCITSKIALPSPGGDPTCADGSAVGGILVAESRATGSNRFGSQNRKLVFLGRKIFRVLLKVVR